MSEDKRKLAKDIASVMDMWADWAMMYPMGGNSSEDHVRDMFFHYMKLKKEMLKIVEEA